MKSYSESTSSFKERLMLFCVIILKLLLSLFPVSYGIFRDEFYYLAMSNRLGLGYVDVPPLAAWLLAPVRFLGGDSLFSLHLLPAFCGALFLSLAYLLVKKMGGNEYARFLTLVAVLLAPYYVAIDSIYTYDTYNKLFWLLFSYLMIRLLQTEKPKYWIYLGIAAGFGLLAKITLLELGFCWIVGLLLTGKRRLLFRREVIWGGILALVISAPYLIWQVQHHFITLEYMKNYSGKINDFSLLGYLSEQKDMLSPATLPLWLCGLGYLLFHHKGRTYRSAGLTYLLLFAISFFMKAKPDFIMPFYVVLIAAGCVWLGNLLAQKGFSWLRVGVAVIVIAIGIYALPLARPLIPATAFIKYYGKMSTGSNVERNALDRLPQFYADRFGWDELTATVVKVYRSLPENDRTKACIVTGNYGEAGAIEFYGKKLGLPLPPLSGHNQYHVWGPGRFSGDVAIAVGLSRQLLTEGYREIRPAARFFNPYAMPYERENPIYVCRHPYKRFPEIKPWLKWLQ